MEEGSVAAIQTDELALPLAGVHPLAADDLARQADSLQELDGALEPVVDKEVRAFCDAVHNGAAQLAHNRPAARQSSHSRAATHCTSASDTPVKATRTCCASTEDGARIGLRN